MSKTVKIYGIDWKVGDVIAEYIINLEAKVSRLTNRGIEDMLDTIATLEAENKKLKSKKYISLVQAREKALFDVEVMEKRNYVEDLEEENKKLKDDLQSERERIADLEEINDSLVRHSNKRIATLEAALNEIMSYTKLGIGSIGRIRGIAGKALGSRKEQSNE